MKARDLKRFVSKMDDDWDIFVSPLIPMRHSSDGSDEEELRMSPHPDERYKIITASQAANWGDNGAYNHHVILAYDAERIYRLDDDGTDEVLDKFIN